MLKFEGDGIFYENIWQMEGVLGKGLLKWKLKSEFKESVIQSEGLMGYPNYDLQAKAQLSYIPISKLFDWLSIFYPKIKDIYAPLLWVSCHVDLKGFLEKKEAIAMNISQCVLSGEENKLSIQDIIIFPFSKKYFEPFEVTISHLNFEKLFDLALLKKHLPVERLEKKGHLKGKLQILSTENVRFEGELLGLKLDIFPEAFKALKGELSLQKKDYKMVVRDLEWEKSEDSQFEGKLSLQGQWDQESLNFESQIKFLKLPAELEEKIFQTQSEALSVEGRGSWNEKTLKSFKGTIKTSELKRKPYTLKNVKFQIDLSEKRLKGSVFSNRLEVSEESEVYKNFKKVLKSSLRKKTLALENLKLPFYKKIHKHPEQKNEDQGKISSVEQDTRILSWNKGAFQVRTVNRSKAFFTTEGVLEKQNKLLGKLFVSFSGSQVFLPWKVSGELFQPVFER